MEYEDYQEMIIEESEDMIKSADGLYTLLSEHDAGEQYRKMAKLMDICSRAIKYRDAAGNVKNDYKESIIEDVFKFYDSFLNLAYEHLKGDERAADYALETIINGR